MSDTCPQFWGGMGFTLGELGVSRLYRDGRLGSIGGGADEVMLGILAKTMGIAEAAAARPNTPWTRELQANREALADTMRRFAKSEIAPHAQRVGRRGRSFRAELYARAGELGLLGIGLSGGTGRHARLVLALKLPVHGSRRPATVRAAARWRGLFSHNIGLAAGDRCTQATRRARGGRPAGAARREDRSPGHHRARRRLRRGRRCAPPQARSEGEGDHYIVDGEKTFITSGMRADWITAAVRTGRTGAAWPASRCCWCPATRRACAHEPVQDGLAVLGHRNDLLRWRASVPARYLIGSEGAGFRMGIMANFNGERLGIAAVALGLAQVCLDEALGVGARAQDLRQAALMHHQALRHKLVDMQMRIASTEAWLEAVLAQKVTGSMPRARRCAEWVAQICMLKNHATQTMQFCADPRRQARASCAAR